MNLTRDILQVQDDGAARTTNPGGTWKLDNPLKGIRNPIPQDLDNPLEGIRDLVQHITRIQWTRELTNST